MITGKTIALIRQTFVGKVMSLLFHMLCRLVITFLPRSKHLLISWLQSPSAVILEPKTIKIYCLKNSKKHGGFYGFFYNKAGSFSDIILPGYLDVLSIWVLFHSPDNPFHIVLGIMSLKGPCATLI